LALFLGAIFTVPTIVTNIAKASPVVGFNAGRIIDDGVFTNTSSMDVSQIQAFLNSKVPVCDTNGTQPSEYGGGTRAQWGQANYGQSTFTCLKDYSEGGRSAAQIIADTANTYQINPQVFLVLLQKEKGLITDTWPLNIQYRSAAGYGCPDSSPGVCNSTYYGFTNQLKWAGTLYRAILNNSPSWYSPFSLGNNDIRWSSSLSCGSGTVNIQNRSTQALYSYTPYQPNQASLNAGYGQGDGCSSYGNRNFYLFFTGWFGSTSFTPVTKCDSKVAGIVCVWSVRKSDGSQFLTSSEAELSSAMFSYGWTDEGIDFYASSTQRAGTVPVHRLLNNNTHYYTADQAEYTSLLAAGGWTDEGTPFYVYPSTASANASHGIYRLYNSTLKQHYWTLDENTKTYLINSGYTLEATPFNTLSGLVDLSLPAAGRANIYSFKGYSGYLYTTSFSELEAVLKAGYSYYGVLTTANEANTGTPVYRLQASGKHLYTANAAERDLAVSKYGYTSEGVGFYVDSTSAQIYRLTNANSNNYYYTASTDEVMSLTNTDGWTYDDVVVDNNITPSPVYRFINLFNNRHFYTIDLSEGSRITNKGWKYETVAFYADKTTGMPVYRLLSYDKHFYTTNTAERDLAVSKYGYQYEGVAFYVSHYGRARLSITGGKR
jgi:hypothetical protein